MDPTRTRGALRPAQCLVQQRSVLVGGRAPQRRHLIALRESKIVSWASVGASALMRGNEAFEPRFLWFSGGSPHFSEPNIWSSSASRVEGTAFERGLPPIKNTPSPHGL